VSSVEVINELKRLKNQLSGKFEQTRGVRIWGEKPDGSIGLLQLSAEGKLLVDAIASVTGKVSIENFPSDYPASGTESRLDSLLAELQGKLETADLAIEAVTKYLQTKITNLPADYPDSGTQTRLDSLLTELQGKLETADLAIEAGTKYLQAKITNFPSDYPDATSQSTLSGIKGQTDKLTFEAVTSKLLVKSTRDWTITELLAVHEQTPWNPPNFDVALSTRLKIGDFSFTQELGRVGLILEAGGAVIDPRSIRALTSSDVISAVQSGAWSVGRTWSLGKATDGVSAKIDENILGFQFLAAEPTALTVDTASLYARVDAYKRLIINAAVVANPPNLDVAMSGIKAGTDYLDDIYTKLAGGLPAALTAAGNLKTAVQEALPAGTNNIGDVDVLTLPTLPTGDNWIGRVKVGDGTNALAIPLAGDAVGRGIFIFGSDYSAAPGPYARLPKVDSEGNLYIKSV
jgi:hypothetical protein